MQKESSVFTKELSEFIVHIEQEDVPLMNDREKLGKKYLDNLFYPTLANKSRQ